MSKRYYEENFKKQLVNIYNQGNHTYRELHEQYGVSPSTIRQWVVRYNNTESFNAKDNLTEQEKELIELRKRNKQLEMENDILKQAALLLGKWNYVCTLVELYNREVIGYSAGPNKDVSLIEKALLRCRYPLKDIKVFHSDRGREYDNKKVDNILETFEIERSLSRKGNPYDNAVIEAMNKVLKVEFIYQNKFETLEELELQLAEYIYWYNHIRIHGSLGYISPIEYRNKDSFKLAA